MNSILPRSRLLAGVALSAIALAGCEVGQVRVEAQWTRAIENYGMLALYPVTEDLQPGDIVLDIPRAEHSTERSPAMVRLGSLERATTMALLQEQETRRLRLERTPRPSPQQSGGGAAATGAAPAGSSVSATAPASSSLSVTARVTPQAPPAARPTNQTTTTAPAPAPNHIGNANSTPLNAARRPVDPPYEAPRLRRTVLPATTAAVTTASNLGAAGPLGTFLTNLGIAGLFSEAVHIRLDELETLGIDALGALRAIQNNRTSWIINNQLRPALLLQLAEHSQRGLANRLCRAEPRPGPQEPALIHVVRQVTYAHSITYEFVEQSAFALRGAAELAAPNSGPGAVPGAMTVPTTTFTGAPPNNAATAIAGAQAAMAQAQQLAAMQPQRAGVTTSFGLGRFGGITMSERHDRPLAVGFQPALSFSLRGSLLALGPDATQWLEEATQWCDQHLGEHRAGNRIATLICANTSAIGSPLPSGCTGVTGANSEARSSFPAARGRARSM